MIKYIQGKEIDLLIPDNSITKSSFLPIQKSDPTDKIITPEEIKKSVVIKESPFQFTSVCKIPVQNAQILMSIPENQMITYQISDQRSIVQLIIEAVEDNSRSQLHELPKLITYRLFENFGILEDQARQQALFVQISHLLFIGNLDYDKYLKFLKGKLKHIEQMAQNYPQILF